MADTEQPAEAVDPWDRQENEPLLWYERFIDYYLPLKRPRTINDAYRAYRTEKDATTAASPAPTRKRPATPEWKRAANTWNWRGRAEAADLHELREQARNDEADRVEARLRRRRILRALGDKVEAALPEVELEKGGKDYSTTLKTVFDQERAEYGDMPEQRVSHSGGIAVATISDEAIDAMTPEEAYARAVKLAAIITAMGTANTAFTGHDEGLREGVQGSE